VSPVYPSTPARSSNQPPKQPPSTICYRARKSFIPQLLAIISLREYKVYKE
jgi:hypothetical protein